MKYQDRVVAFIDILGFGDLLKSTVLDSYNNKKNNEEKISELFNVFIRIRELMGADEPIEGVAESRQVTQFSDSIVISFELKDEHIEFKYMLGELLHLTVELLKSQIIIRGGIYYGPLIHTDKALFGPGLVDAYQVESKAAVSPRIILPKSLYDKDNQFQKLLKNTHSNLELNDLIERDEDDFFYLDYFDKCQHPKLKIFINDNEYIDHMKRLKKFIIKGLETKSPGIYSKYGWMKTKWNKTVIKYQETKTRNKLKRAGRDQLSKYFSSEKLIKTSM